MATQRAYIISGNTLDEVKQSFNFHLQDIADRMDKIEGWRGGSSIESDLDMNDNSINNVNINADQATIDSLAVTDATFNGDFELLDTFYEDLRFPASAINPPGQAGDPDFDTTNGGWLFAAGSTEVLFLAAQMPHAWKEGTELHPHVHWQKTAAESGDCYWQLEYKIAPISEVMDAAFTTIFNTTTLNTDNNLANEHLITDIGNISMTGKGFSDMLLMKLSRIGGNAADTAASDVRLLEFDIHYEVSSFGTADEYSR